MTIKYIVGNKNISHVPHVPFGEDEINFLEDLSEAIKKDFRSKNQSDILSFAFWCRKKNLINLKKKNEDKLIKKGIGLIFHITPSNVPTNFLFSLILGLITGNSNIIKVPFKEFLQIKIICDCLKKALKKNKKMQGRITVIKYNEDIYTKKFSSICDGRMIWGGDETIKIIKKFETKPKNRDVTFADRYSMALIDAKKIISLDKKNIYNLGNAFYNDTFKFDQNACTSPHLIIWYGNNKDINQAKNIFWSSLHEIVKKKYEITNFVANEKLKLLYSLAIENGSLNKIISHENYIYRYDLKKIPQNNDQLRGKWGIFFEAKTRSLSKLTYFVNEKYQTLTYFGISKKILEKFIIKNNLTGIDKIVPIGSSMNLSLIWDGYDLKNILTRKIEIL